MKILGTKATKIRQCNGSSEPSHAWHLPTKEKKNDVIGQKKEVRVDKKVAKEDAFHITPRHFIPHPVFLRGKYHKFNFMLIIQIYDTSAGW